MDHDFINVSSMIQMHDPQNPLLIEITSFLSGDHSNISKLQSLVNEATADQLIYTFSYIGHLILKKIKYKTSQTPDSKVLLELIGLVTPKIPPVVLLNGAFNINWGQYQPHSIFNIFYDSINKRVLNLRSYLQPFSIYGNIFPYSLFRKTNKLISSQFYGIFIDFESDPSYQSATLAHFKSLLINHSPLHYFRPLINQKTASKSILTRALIDLISQLNSLKNATQEELSYAFSSIFHYVHVFTLSNDIDGQLFCQYFHSFPYMSPFCVLAMMNNIPSNLYLFNLLAPAPLFHFSSNYNNSNLKNHSNDDSECTVHSVSKQYRIIDFSTNNTYDSFLIKVPQVLVQYFYSKPSLNETVGSLSDSSSDVDFFEYFHSNSGTFSKIKNICYFLLKMQTKELDSSLISSMGIVLLRGIFFASYRYMPYFIKSNIFTPLCNKFLRTVFNTLAPAFYDNIVQTFFDSSIEKKSPETLFYYCSFTYSILLSFLVHGDSHIVQDFCLNLMHHPSCSLLAHNLLLKLLFCGNNYCTQTTFNLLLKSDDLISYLLFIDYLNVYYCNSDDSELFYQTQKYRNELLKNSPFSFDSDLFHDTKNYQSPFIDSLNFELCKLNPLHLNLNSIKIVSEFLSSPFSNAFQFPQKPPKNYPHYFDSSIQIQPLDYDPILRLMLLCYSGHIKEEDYSQFLVNEVQKLLSQTTFPEELNGNFGMSFGILSYPTAQLLFGKLVEKQHYQLAESLLDSMKPYFLSDPLILHWFHLFLVLHRSYLTNILKNKLLSLLFQLSQVSSLVSQYDSKNMAYTISQFQLSVFEKIIQPPETINNEYKSYFQENEVAFACIILLDSRTDEEIAEELLRPMYELQRMWPNRGRSIVALSKIAAMLSDEIEISFFNKLISKEICESSLYAGYTFLLNVSFNFFKWVCINGVKMIDKDPSKLDLFMKMIVPSFMRLENNEEISTELLCGLLSNVSKSTPKYLQESVIDVVELMYLQLKLQKSKQKLIEAANDLEPSLNLLFASSLDVVLKH